METRATASHHDVFNGDADGLCALQQLRLAQPRQAQLLTGVKRDIALLQRVRAQAGDTVTVLDISLDRNREALLALLQQGVAIEYFDHHFAGTIPTHPLFTAHLDPAPDVCTSVLVDRWLAGRHRAWAVVGAFGDGLPGTAETLAAQLDLTPAQRQQLCRLGEAMNYNAYGECEADLLVAPKELALAMRPYADPFAFLAGSRVAESLCRRRSEDLALALAVPRREQGSGAAVVMLPDAAWARRVQGSFAHVLVEREPGRAHAVLCERSDGTYVVSVRAPRSRPQGADALCRAFAGGGGRAGAAGIDVLPRERLEQFLQAFTGAYPAA
jgi:hypothetical protein